MDDYFHGAGGDGCVYTTNACYVPLCWEFNNSYFPEWFIGDVCSDDALKGGEGVASAMSYVYYLENFKGVAENDMLLDMYRANYQGIGRCNLAIQQIPTVEPDTVMDARLQERLLGECYFLRAYYYFRLVRIFGGVPISTQVLDGENSKLDRATADQVYDQIISDLTEAEARLWSRRDPSFTTSDWGRATKGAAQAMLQKVYLYRHDYANSLAWGDKVIQSGDYNLVDNYASNFTLEGENNDESVFEIQYGEENSSDYGGVNAHVGATRGTFTTVLTRGRQYGGWGWNHPTQCLFDEFEEGDARREATILDPLSIYMCPNKIGDAPCGWSYRGYNPPAVCGRCGQAADWKHPVETRDYYLGICYYNAKTGLYSADGTTVARELAHDTRGELNKKEIRYADVLLMHAEAAAELGQTTVAENDLETVRARARAWIIANDTTGLDPNDVLPAYPNYTFKENGIGSPISAGSDLKKAIRHERRVELAMESHRWFDLCRWGSAEQVMNAYRDAESSEVRGEMGVFNPSVHYLFPIPPKEIELNPMSQNPGY